MDDTLDELIPERDARAMVRLLAEVASIDGGHEDKKRGLMDGLAELISADFWIWGLVSDLDPKSPPVYSSMITGGFAPEQLPKLLAVLDGDNVKVNGMGEPLKQEVAAGTSQLTRLASDCLSENVPRAQELAGRWKQAGIGAPLVCHRPMANRSVSSIGLYRRHDRSPFSGRDARVAHILLTEVDWLHEQGWPWELSLEVPQLPNRCRTALNFLLDGMTRKQIADQMQISVHTVNEYVKRIYTFYSVHSHPELLNRFRVGDGKGQTA